MDGIYNHYIIDLSCNNNFVQVPTVQGDGNNVRGFEVELIANNVQYVVDSSTTAVFIAGTKPDTKQILNECTITEEGYILVDITQQMSAIAGRGDYSIMLISKSNNSQLKSFPFYILTTASSFSASEVTSTDEYQALAKSLTEASVLSEQMEEILDEEAIRVANEEARIASETERTNAEAIRDANEATRQSNESDRADAEVLRVNAETVRSDAEIVRQEKETERINAEAIRVANEEIRVSNENARVIAENTRDTAETQRIVDENLRQSQETIRQEALTATQTATTNANNATTRANTISSELESKLASGYFNGKDGIVTTVEINQLGFQIVDDNLILTYVEGNTDAENFSINDDGHLVYNVAS